MCSSQLDRTRLDRAISRAEGDLHVGGVESEFDDFEVRDRGIAKQSRAADLLAVLEPLAALVATDPDAERGLEILTALAAGRAEIEGQALAALDRLIADHPEARDGVDALLRYVRGRR